MTVIRGPKRYPCGTPGKYKQGCRCDRCRAAKSAVDREWYARNSKARPLTKRQQRIIDRVDTPTTWRCVCGRLEDKDHRCGAPQAWEIQQDADAAFYAQLATHPPTR